MGNRTSSRLPDTASSCSSIAKIDRWRFVAAVVAIPLFDALLGYMVFPIVWWLGDHGAFRPMSPQQAALGFGTLAGVLGLLVMITAALPITVWLIRHGRTSIRHFAAAGVVLGNVPFTVYLWVALIFTLLHLLAGTLAEHLSPAAELLAGGLRAVLIGSVMGAMSGLMFWLIAGPQSAR
jgi:hypothetical protein